MNYEKVKIVALERYKKALKEIELCKEIAEKIEPSLPDGWKCEIDDVVWNLEITKYGADSGEFKLVCKLVEGAIGEKLKRSARVLRGGTKPHILRAEKYLHQIKEDIYVGVEVKLYNPENMPDCKIEWKRRWIKEAVVSDECLGINQKK